MLSVRMMLFIATTRIMSLTTSMAMRPIYNVVSFSSQARNHVAGLVLVYWINRHLTPLPKWLCTACALAGACHPWALRFTFYFSQKMGPAWGPHISLAWATWPCFLLFPLNPAHGTSATVDSVTEIVLLGALALLFQAPWEALYPFLQHASIVLPYLARTTSIIGYDLLLRASAGCSYQRSAKRRRLSQVVVAILLLLGIILPTSPRPQLVSEIPWPGPNDNPVRLLSTTNSITGVVSAVEYRFHNQWIRVLRSDHSILGGLWVGEERQKAARGHQLSVDEQRHYHSQTLDRAQSIFVAFYLQEALRLVRRPPRLASEDNENALFIGLGIGTAAKAFMRHNITTSVAEIDPAVYAMARQFFAFPLPSHVYLEDARQVLKRQEKQYDYIVHDVFTGGTVPSALFTTETWDEVKGNLKPDGVLAVNFAGVLQSRAAEAILATLLGAFESCRAIDENPTGGSPGHTNAVIFCSRMPRIEFRNPVEADMLATGNRQRMFQDLSSREIPIQHLKANGPVLCDANATLLADWQQGAAAEHWRILRAQFGQEFWLTY